MDGQFLYEFIGFGAMDNQLSYEFIGFWAMDAIFLVNSKVWVGSLWIPKMEHLGQTRI